MCIIIIISLVNNQQTIQSIYTQKMYGHLMRCLYCMSIKLYWQDGDGDLRTRGVGQDVGVASAFNGVA